MLIRSVFSRGTSPQGGGGVSLDARSDFAGRAANSQLTVDITDGGFWSNDGNASWKTIRDAQAYAFGGFPSNLSRYIEYRIFGTQSSYNTLSGLAVPPDGGARYYRGILGFAFPPAIVLGGNSFHPIE